MHGPDQPRQLLSVVHVAAPGEHDLANGLLRKDATHCEQFRHSIIGRSVT